MEVMIKLDEDQIDKIVIDELKNAIALLEMELDNRNRNANSFGVFTSDKEKDIVEIENHLLAMKTTLDWFEPSWMRNED
jgi:hypothetical protein